MKQLLAVFLATIFSAANAQPLTGFSVKAKNFSSELELVASQLSQAKSISAEEASELSGAAEIINSDLQKTPRANALFLVKSEIYKALLDNPYLPEQDKILLNGALLKTVERKLEKHQIVYTDFSQWIMTSVLAEFAQYRKDGFIDSYQTASGNDVKSRTRALELKRSAKYLSPWIVAFIENSPEDFNALVTKVAKGVVKGLARKTYYFKQFSSRHSSESMEEIFSAPKVEPPKETKSPMEPESLELEKERREAQSREAVEPLGEADLENASEAIDTIIDSGEEGGEEKGWKPK